MLEHKNYHPDYTEEAAQALLLETRFVASAQAYAAGLITLGEALAFGFGTPRALLDGIPSSFALTRLVHEVGRRIAYGDLPVSSDLWRQQALAFDLWRQKQGQESVRSHVNPPFSLTFAENSVPANYERYLKRRRYPFDEDDVLELVKNEFFLACMDAFRRGLIQGKDAELKLFPKLNLPRDLSAAAYGMLQVEVARRIGQGRIALAPDIQERFPDAYRPEPDRPLPVCPAPASMRSGTG